MTLLPSPGSAMTRPARIAPYPARATGAASMMKRSSRDQSPTPAVRANSVRVRARRKMGAGDARAVQIGGYRLREAPDVGLAGGVARFQPVRDDVGGDRADIEDGSVARFHHPRGIQRREVGQCHDVQLGHLRYRHGVALVDLEAQDPHSGVVDQVLDFDTKFVDARHELGSGARPGQVHRDGVDANTVACAQFVGQFAQLRGTALTRHPTTSMPSAANRIASSRPSPLDAPVTRAVVMWSDPPCRSAALHVDRNVIGPGLSGGHVRDLDVAALELARSGVDQPVLLALPVDGLRVEHHNPDLARLEPAPLL